MTDGLLQLGQRVHLIGVGGFGMSAIARVLIGQGYEVSGSDIKANALTATLTDIGVTVHIGHDGRYVEGVDGVIATSAVPDDHVEIVAARQANIPVYRRSQCIAALMHGKTVIAIAGTHGKTTTTSMIAHVLLQTGYAPSYIVGGVMGNTGTNAAVGTGDAFVIEADEYDNMFLGLQPDVAVITSVEWDHPDFFPTPQALLDSFRQFIGRVEQSSKPLLIAYGDDVAVRQLVEQANVPFQTYGLHESAQWRAVKVRYEAAGTRFEVQYASQALGDVVLRVPGDHNILNALAALAVAMHQGAAFEAIAQALNGFITAGRRFDVRADINDIAIVDDYAHHPTAIRTTIDAARKRYPQREIWAVWQPHTYSRTQRLYDDFLAAFDAAHHVVVTDIFAAREASNPDVHSAGLVAAMQHPHVQHAPSLSDAVGVLIEQVKSPAVVLIMSAGDAPQIGIDYLAYLMGQG